MYYNFSYHAIDHNEVIFDASFSRKQELVAPQLLNKYQLLHTRFDQISDHKHDIYLYVKLSTKLTSAISRVHVYKNWTVAFFLSMVLEVTVGKNSKQTLPQVEKVTVYKFVITFWTGTSNHKVNNYWVSATFPS